MPLDPADASRHSIGPLEYLGGLWLRGDDPRFGGLSDLRVSADGERLFAVSDCGNGFMARLRYDASGRLVGLGEARIVGLTDPDGRPLAMNDIDAESLVAVPGGALEVGFEGRSRIHTYGPAFEGPARREVSPAALAECGSNGGLELMADAGGGKRLLVCEERRGASSTVPAWIGFRDALAGADVSAHVRRRLDRAALPAHGRGAAPERRPAGRRAALPAARRAPGAPRARDTRRPGRASPRASSRASSRR